MCSMYWNLKSEYTCPVCNKLTKDILQTHFLGEVGSCMNEYELGKVVPELDGFTGELPKNDLFLGQCDHCDAWFDVQADIKDGIVVSLNPVVTVFDEKNVHINRSCERIDPPPPQAKGNTIVVTRRKFEMCEDAETHLYCRGYIVKVTFSGSQTTIEICTCECHKEDNDVV